MIVRLNSIRAYLIALLFLINTPLAFSQWELISPNYPANDANMMYWRDVHFINQDTGFVIGDPNHDSYSDLIIRTLIGGVNWDTTFVGSIVGVDYNNSSVYSIDFPNNDSVGYVSCLGEVLKTVDYGSTWVATDVLNQWLFQKDWRAMQFINKDTGYIAFQDGGAEFLRTLDGGVTWNPDPVMTGIRNFNAYNGIFTGCHGGWAILDEQTLTWNSGAIVPAIIGNQYLVQSVYFKDRIIIIGETWTGTQYVYSDDMGLTWTYKRLNFNGLFDIQMINDNIGYISGSFPGTIKTFDGGETWYFMEVDNLGTNMYTNFNNFCMVNDSVGYAVTTSGIYKTTNGAGTAQFLIEELASVAENETNNLTAFPSPFTTTLNLNFNTLTNGKLSVFDVNGKLVYTETVINSNSTTVNTTEFTKGVYFYKLVDISTGLLVGNGKVVKR